MKKQCKNPRKSIFQNELFVKFNPVLALMTFWMVGQGAAAFATEPSVPAFSDFIVDEAHVLSASEYAEIRNQLKDFQDRTGGQIAILTVPNLGGDSIEGFSIRVADRWKVGRAQQDDGVIIV